MRLQIALDIADTARVLGIADGVHDVIDIVEVGTPVILKEGLAPVRALKARYPDLTVLADTKIMDAGALEASDACEAGADILTVLAVSDDATIREAVDAAHARSCEVMADLMCVRDIPARSRQLVALGVDYVCVHTGTDMQRQGRTPLKDLEELVSAIDPGRACVAGGVSLASVERYAALRPGIVIAGSALYHAADIRAAVVAMTEALGS